MLGFAVADQLDRFNPFHSVRAYEKPSHRTLLPSSQHPKRTHSRIKRDKNQIDSSKYTGPDDIKRDKERNEMRREQKRNKAHRLELIRDSDLLLFFHSELFHSISDGNSRAGSSLHRRQHVSNPCN